MGMAELSTFCKIREYIFPRRSSSKLNHSVSLHVLTCPVQFSKSLDSLGLGSKRHSLWIWQPEHYLEEWTCLIISFFLHNTTLMVRWWHRKNVGSKIWQGFLLCEHLIQPDFNSFWQLGSYVWCISIQMLLCTRAIFFPSEFLDPLFKSGQDYILFFF